MTLSTKRTVTSHLRSLNIKKTTTSGDGNSDPVFGKTQKCGAVILRLLFKFIKPVTETRDSYLNLNFSSGYFFYYLGSNNLMFLRQELSTFTICFSPNKIKLFEVFLWKTKKKVPYFIGTNMLQMILDL